MHDTRTIWLHAEAPPKPAPGAPCSGCGVCCASEPCPVGIVVSASLRGRCRALSWHAAERRYRCGLLAAAAPGFEAQPRRRRWRETLLRRWIGAGTGCDSEAEALPRRVTAD